MIDNPLIAISPIDGRYHGGVQPLRQIVSEFGLIRFRVEVEIEWLIALSAACPDNVLPTLSERAIGSLRSLIESFSIEDAKRIKEIEKTTNHDVKAVEYYLREYIERTPELAVLAPFIHFACTSEDINNVSYALMLKATRDLVMLPKLDEIIQMLRELAHEHANLSMLSRTHGQSASPTTLGKEMANVAARLIRERQQLENLTILGKFNGAVGNFNAHHISFPELNWLTISKNFVESLGLEWNAYTTQIEPHDYMASLFDAQRRINTILMDFSRDMWSYISVGYFRQKLKDGEVGSSTMPHKVNPIDFENAEGNLGVANALLGFFSEKLPISRWQRDLSDSTTQRNLGLGFAHSYLAYASLLRGLKKCEVNADVIAEDLNENWEVLGEAIQTVMRRYQITDAYERLKALTRGKRINAEDLKAFVDTLPIPDDEKARLKMLRPRTYTGLACMLAENI